MAPQWVDVGANMLRRELLAQVARAGGADRRLSGMRRSAKAIDFDISTVHGATVEALVRPTAGGAGALAILEFGTRNRRQGGSSPAKRPVERAMAATLPAIEADLRRRFDNAVR